MSLEEIGEGDNSLLCLTNKYSCCSETSEGEWYGPDNVKIMEVMENTDPEGFYTSRGPGLVKLNKENDVTVSGIFRCQISDVQDITQEIYIGVYQTGTGKV